MNIFTTARSRRQDYLDSLFCRAFRGNSIAARLNCRYDGVQPGFGGHPDTMQFTDYITGSTTYGNSYEEVREKLETMRNKFGGGRE